MEVRKKKMSRGVVVPTQPAIDRTGRSLALARGKVLARRPSAFLSAVRVTGTSVIQRPREVVS